MVFLATERRLVGITDTLSHGFYEERIVVMTYRLVCGRFLTRDPNEAGRNWLRYCGQNPVGRCDYRGSDYVVIVAPRNGIGTGTHVSIGIGRDPSRTPDSWYGFYPSDPDEGGSSSSRSSSSSSSSGIGSRGRGFVRMGDRPTDSQLEHCRAEYRVVDKPTADKMRNQLLGAAKDSRQGKSPHSYDLEKYNCTDWVIDLLRQYFPNDGINFDHIAHPSKPKSLVDVLGENEHWAGGLPWVRENN